ATRGSETLAQPPPLESCNTGLMDPVGGEMIAGEGVAVEEEDSVALAGEEHRRGGASAAGTDHNRVVHCRTFLSGQSQCHSTTVRREGPGCLAGQDGDE